MATKFYLADGTDDRHRRHHPAGVLREHGRGLPRLHPRPQARPRHRRARSRRHRQVHRRPSRVTHRRRRGDRRDAARELPALRVQRAALVPLRRRGRRQPLRPLPLGARRRRSEPRPKRKRKARGPDYLQEDLAEPARPRPGRVHPLRAARRGRRPDRRPDRGLARRPASGHARPPRAHRARAPTASRATTCSCSTPPASPTASSCSDDPILRFRTDAYAESVLRRSGVARK